MSFLHCVQAVRPDGPGRLPERGQALSVTKSLYLTEARCFVAALLRMTSHAIG